MGRSTHFQVAWPVVGLSVLLTAACWASDVYIGRLHSHLAESLRADAARLQGAQQAQIHLREYRIFTVVLAAGPDAVRRARADAARQKFLAALDDLRGAVDTPADRDDLAALEAGWSGYEADLGRDFEAGPVFRSVAEFAAWTDGHPVARLLEPCTRLVDRAEARMAETSRRSEAQSRWAGRGLFVIGLVGPLAGLLGGYTIARQLSRRVARLSVNVRAVSAHLDHDLGGMTIESPQTLADLDGQLERVVGRVRAVCERVQEQERDLLRAEQLAAVGRLAAGVAHEVRNPLTGIKMLVESAVRPVGATPLNRRDLELIRDEIDRLERTVQGLLDYAKPDTVVRRPRDVRGEIERAVEVVAARAGRGGVTVEFVAGADPLPAAIDADRFASLLSNLLINGVDASPAGGTVRVAAERAAGTIRVTVRDSGPGIPAALNDTLFTPFASTKPNGTGLGLAVARRAAEAHGGTLTAANGPLGGAVFTVTIPGAEAGDAETAGR